MDVVKVSESIIICIYLIFINYTCVNYITRNNSKSFKPGFDNVNMVVKFGHFEVCDSLRVLEHIMAHLIVVIDWIVIL